MTAFHSPGGEPDSSQEIHRGTLRLPPASVAQSARTSARLHFAGAAAYAIFPALVPAAHGYFGTGHDLGTLGMAVGMFGLGVAMFASPWLARRPSVVNGAVAYLVSAYMLYLAHDRSLDVSAVVAVLMVMSAMTSSLPFTMPARRTLFGYVAMMLAGSILVWFTTPAPLVAGELLTAAVGMLGVVALVTQTAWLRVVGQLQHVERDRASVLQNAPIALIALNPRRKVVFAEGKGLAALGLDENVVGRVIPLEGVGLPAVLAPLGASPLVHRFEAVVQQNGRTFEAAFEPVETPGAGGGVVVVVTDITARAEAERALVEREQQASHDALHDALTGLPNRALLYDRLERVIARRRRKVEAFAVLFMDLDRFKTINDGLGHLAGDELLVEFSRRLGQCTRPTDTTARLGGDEFALLLEGVRDPGEVHRVAQRIQDVLRPPFVLTGHEVVVSASIGIAIATAAHRRPEEILRDADIAMYRAKSAGRDQYVIFDEAMHQEAMALLRLETDLRRAVARDEFEVHYQPLISFAYQRTCGYEALVRWRHPERGLLPPAAFIEMAEETGLIVPLGMLVLRRACATIRAMMTAFPKRSWLQMSVNLSARQFAHRDLVQSVREIVQETGVNPRWLIFEITESVLMEDLDGVLPVLEELRQLGVHIEIDDFGTGYSSLAYLHRIPFDRLKIDRSFVGQMELGVEQVALVKTIVSLARNLGVGVVAEGVETDVQCSKVAQLGVDVAQGYYFAMPMPEEQALAWLAEDREWVNARQMTDLSGTH